MADAVASLRGVSKVFPNGVAALAPVSFDIARHSFVSLLGPSGCGKTTLLRVIAELEQPSAGCIEWPGGRPKLGFVFQEPTLMPWADVRANVALPLTLGQKPEADGQAKIDEALALVGLSDFGKALPRELSGGMKMRVSIARALATDPQLLLLDEPFAALDEFTRHRLNDDLLALWEKRKLTVVFVTHSIEESAYLSTRVLVLRARPGRVIADLPNGAPFPRGNSFRHSAEYRAFSGLIVSALAQGYDARGEVA